MCERARMFLSVNLIYVAGTCESRGSLEASMQFGMLIGTMFVPSVSDKRNGSFGPGGLASQIPEECWYLSNCQNSGK